MANTDTARLELHTCSVTDAAHGIEAWNAAEASVIDCLITDSGTGIFAASGAPVVIVERSNVVHNVKGLVCTDALSASIPTTGDNVIDRNGTNNIDCTFVRQPQM